MTPIGTLPCAFLFASGGGDERGATLDEAFLDALKLADASGTTETRVLRGGVLLAGLSYKTTAIKVTPPSNERRSKGVAEGAQTTQHADRALYAVLVGDFVETCLAQWNTLDPEKFWDYAGNHALDATFTPTLTLDVARTMDRTLRSHPRYIGAVSPDLGNPLHRYLFVDAMFKDAFIRDGSVVVQGGCGGQHDGQFFGASAFSRNGLLILPFEEFDRAAPPVPLPPALSARGLVTQMRLQRRMAPDLHQKIMAALTRSAALENLSKPFEWDLTRLPDSPEEASVQAGKVSNYLLDPDHGDGKSKARFFETTLAITRADSQFLRAQLVDRLQNVSYEDVRLDEYGIRFTAYLPVKGRNGQTATIETGWIVRPGERASFVTAFPASKDEILEEQAEAPALLPDTLTGDHRWQSLYELGDAAGTEAMQGCVPKPMVVEGRVYMEGVCGGAFVVVRDARKGFARWLLKTGKGHKYHGGGGAISAQQVGQSAETAKAYANAFARVLQRNGVACSVDAYLT